MAQSGPTQTFAYLNTQLNTEQVWKGMTYSHYSLHTSTPVRAELGAFPSYIPGIIHPTKYMAYQTTNAHPLLAKAVITQKAITSKPQLVWWSNAWRILDHCKLTESTLPSHTTSNLKDELQGEYRRWWLEFLVVPTNMPKLTTFRLFHPSFHMASYRLPTLSSTNS